MRKTYRLISRNANRIISCVFPASLIKMVYFLKDFLSHYIGYLIQSYIFIHHLLLSYSTKVFLFVNIGIYGDFPKKTRFFSLTLIPQHYNLIFFIST